MCPPMMDVAADQADGGAVSTLEPHWSQAAAHLFPHSNPFCRVPAVEGARTVGLDNGAMKYTLGGGRGGAGWRMLTWLLQPASTVTTEGWRQQAGERLPARGRGRGRGEERVDPS